jgi:diguanylate cyclase (GGDEF)-like protein
MAHDDHRGDGEVDLGLLRRLTAGESGAGEHGELTYEELLWMAFHDQLTGLANYRAFVQRYDEEIKRAARYQRVVSLLVMDLDHFKKLNDERGHEVGNRVLVHVAGLLAARVRETDLVARYGGDELTVILPETAKHEAVRLAEALLQGIASTPFPLDGAEALPVTVSMGLASYPRDARDPEALIACADRALYASKAAGRARLTAFEPDTGARLTYRPGDAQAVRTVHVMGEFNGWDRTVDPMTREPDGGFALALRLAPGKYAYKFIVDSELYIADPASPVSVPDGFGGRNSVLVVEPAAEPA